MYVCVTGDPGSQGCTIVGLDILGTRHSKVFNLLLERMSFSLDNSGVVVCGGIMNERCQPDNSGRQAALKPNLYPTDVLNILVETGGFRIITSSTSQQQNIGGVSCSHVVWTLEK